MDDLLLDPLRPQHDRPAEDLTRRRPRLALLAASIAVLAAGCGGGEDEASSGLVNDLAGAGGSLVWALAGQPAQLDPLYAESVSEALVSRQIHEPLVETLRGPFGDRHETSGLALSVTPYAGARIWRVRLRPGVRFQDGAPFNAQAVLTNIERWQAMPELSGLPVAPQLLVDAPKPDQVRFILAAPDPRFDLELGSPRLGLVSPAALKRADGGRLSLVQVTDSGTGPFELRERDADRLLLARNSDWWGRDHGLGPALDQLEFEVEPVERERFGELAAGSVEVAGEFGPRYRRAVRRDPLLTIASESAGGATASERSVRGIPPGGRVPSLNALWLTRLAGAEQ